MNIDKKPATQTFKESTTFEERVKQSAKIQEKHPDKISVICEKHKKSKLEQLDKNKYLVTDKYKVYQFIHLLRNRISLKQQEALYLFVQGKILLKSDSKMSEVYAQYKDPDGFLYIEYCEYNSFGAEGEKEQEKQDEWKIEWKLLLIFNKKPALSFPRRSPPIFIFVLLYIL